MKTVHRYDVPFLARVEVEMPIGASIIQVGHSDRIEHGLAVWAVVDAHRAMATQVLFIRGTGHDLGDAAGHAYIGSFTTPLSSNVALWWHVFDGGEVKLP